MRVFGAKSTQAPSANGRKANSTRFHVEITLYQYQYVNQSVFLFFHLLTYLPMKSGAVCPQASNEIEPSKTMFLIWRLI